MLLFRNVTLSVRQAVSDLFANPPTGLTNPYSVYGEDRFIDETFQPTRPYLWLLESRVPPRETRLPMVIIERAPTLSSEFEMGNREGSLQVVNLHVFARSRGERDDLAAFLYENLKALTVFDFSSQPPTPRYRVDVLSRASGSNSVAPDLGLEGALANWETVRIEFQLRD